MYLRTKSGKKVVSFLAALSAALMMGGTALPMTVHAASDGTSVVTASYLYVRSGPGTQYWIMDGFDEGATVTILDEEDGWYQVRLSGSKTGWVSGEYVQTVSAKENKSSETKTDSESTKCTTATTAAKNETAKTTAAKSETSKNNTSKSDDTKKTAAAATVTDSGMGIVTVTGVYTNLRSGAGTSYKVITRMYQGTKGAILDKQGTWFKVKLADGTVGWVSQKYIKTTGYTERKTASKTTSSKTVAGTGKIMIDASTVYARSSASRSGAIVGTVRQNEVYSYTAVKDGWYLIKTPGGINAYVSGENVKPFTDYAVQGGGKYLWPTQTATRISSRFGSRDGRNHNGIDIAAPGGSQIIAVAAGTIVDKSYEGGGYGYYLKVQQNDGLTVIYAHMREPSFRSVNSTVKAGDTLGLVGSTGRSTGNHLHLEFRRGSTRIDPLQYYPNMQ